MYLHKLQSHFACVFCRMPILRISRLTNLINNKDIFMCILHFHASAGYLQHYEALLKELNLHPDGDASKEAPLDQCDVK